MDQKKKMHVSKVLGSMKDASIYMRMSTDMIISDGGKAKATLGATAHATRPSAKGIENHCSLICRSSISLSVGFD